MKKFDTKYIKEYIENHKKELCCVLCGCIETWLGSACVVYCDGDYKIDLFKLNSRIEKGTMRTPYMVAIYNDGEICYLMCGEEVYEVCE